MIMIGSLNNMPLSVADKTHRQKKNQQEHLSFEHYWQASFNVHI